MSQTHIIYLKVAAVTEATRVGSLVYIACSSTFKTKNILSEFSKNGSRTRSRSTTSAISVKQMVTTLPVRSANTRVIQPTTKMLSIAVSAYFSVN